MGSFFLEYYLLRPNSYTIREKELILPKVKKPDSIQSKLEETTGTEQEIVFKSLQPASFWAVTEYEALAIDEVGKKQIELAVEAPIPPKIEEPVFQPLSSWAALEPRLRTALAQLSQSHALDIPKLGDKLSKAQIPQQLPRAQRYGWGSSLQVIDDRNRHLAPYLPDHAWLLRQLQQFFPGDTLETAFLDASFDEPMRYTKDGGIEKYRTPAGKRVLVLSDLGCLAEDGGRSRRFWLQFGRRLRAEKCKAVALLPCSLQQCEPEFHELYQLVCWEHPAPPRLDRSQHELLCEPLLQLLAPTWRFSPSLLRSIRFLLDIRKFPASLESLVWQHTATQDLNLTTSALNAEESMQRWESFQQKEPALQKRALEKIRSWHFNLPPEIWYSTIWNLSEDSQQLLNPEDVEKAKEFLRHIAHRSLDGSDQPLKANAHAWIDRNLKRLSPSAKRDLALKESVLQLRRAQQRWEQNSEEIEANEVTIRKLLLSQRGDQFFLTRQAESQQSPGSLLAELNGEAVELNLEVLEISSLSFKEQDELFWKSRTLPTWANRWGKDEYGLWVEFVYKNVPQRMRWIEPGTFMMGSPEDEPERYDDEGPQHQVTISQGYWLFDTAVTQELWVAVVGENPSRFSEDIQNPVERVSWDDCREFLEKLNQELPGLELELPSEAQWEYACRARTTTPFSFGENITPDQVNYDGDIPYNNGDKGEYREKTVAVKSLPPNPWGLYEMHGNVREWCLDGVRDYSAEAVTDPLGSTEAGALRVIRGGSWFGDARLCRSACRSWRDPGFRGDLLGFRPCRVQVSQAGQAAQPATFGAAAQAERADRRKGRGEAVEINLPSTQNPTVEQAIPNFDGQLLLRTDREKLTLQRFNKPRWASAMGRDQFSLWAEFTIKTGQVSVTQRMRWIPPGQFLMGSPEDEPERMDQESPQHAVVISKGYWLFDTAVTQELWVAVMGDNPSQFQKEKTVKKLFRKQTQREMKAKHPVEKISREDCQQFFEKINNLISDLQLELPSEAQWEYACRAGTTTPFSFGENITPDQVNYHGNYPYKNGEKGEYRKKTVAVKSFSPNPWGLYEMHGNVWEWVADAWHENYEGVPEDGSVWEGEAGARRVVRGGSWIDNALFCRSAYRDAYRPGNRFDYLGFRPCRVQA